MGMILSHMSASSGQLSHAGYSAIAVTGSMLFGPSASSLNGLSARAPDAAYVFSGSASDKAVFLGDVVISGSLSTGGGLGFVDAADDAAAQRLAVFDDGNTVGGDANLTWDGSDLQLANNIGLVLSTDDAEKIESDGTDLTVNSGGDINLTATSDVNVPANVGLTFGDDGEKIEGNGTDLTIASSDLINLSASKAVVVPTGVRMEFVSGSGEHIVGNGTNLTLASGADIELSATADVNVPANVGMTFGDDGEKIEGDGTDLTIASSNLLNLSAATDVVIPANVGLILDGSGAEKIESDGTDITISVGAGGDVNLPASVGLTFGDDGEKIEGDGSNLAINSSGNLTLDASSGVSVDAGAASNLSTSAGDLTVNASAARVILSGSSAADSVLVQSEMTVAGDAIFSNNVTVNGNFDVNGTTTTINSANMQVQDSIIGLGISGSGVFNNVGDRAVIFTRGLTAAALPALNWGVDDKFHFAKYLASPASGAMGSPSSYVDIKANNIELAGGLSLPDSDASHSLVLEANGGNLTANRTLDFVVNDGNRTLTIEADSILNQDLSSDAAVSFAGVTGSEGFQVGTTGGSQLKNAAGVLQVITLNGVEISGSLSPSVADGFALGSATKEWSDLFLSDGAVINLGADQDVTLTHVADTGVLLNGASVVQFRDSALAIGSSADGQLDVDADAEVEITAPIVDIDASNAVRISNDLELDSDAAVLKMGADSDVSLTHVADTGLLLNAAMVMQFRDSALSVGSSADGQLDVQADSIVEVTAGGVEYRFDSTAFFPAVDNSYDLGKAVNRFRNVYTGDLNLQNERGDWTLIEEESFISFRNNKTGRRFRMIMEDITGTGTYGPGNDGQL